MKLNLINIEPVRLDQLLSNEIVDLSRSQIKTLIENNNITVNGNPVSKPGQKVKGDLEIEIEVSLNEESKILP